MTGNQDRRFWIAAGLGLVLVIVIPVWLLVISPLRSSAETLHADTETVELQNVALEVETALLRTKAKDRDELVASLDFALKALPWTTKLPAFFNLLSQHSAAHGVELTSVSVGASTTPGQPASTSTDPALTTQAVPVTIVSTARAIDQLFFLRDVQEIGPRRALVMSTSIVPTVKGSIEASSTMTVQLTIFSSPASPSMRDQLKEILSDGTTS